MSKGKSFIHQRASDSDFFSNTNTHTHTHTHTHTQTQKKKSDSNIRVNDMDKLHFKVWKVLLYY